MHACPPLGARNIQKSRAVIRREIEGNRNGFATARRRVIEVGDRVTSNKTGKFEETGCDSGSRHLPLSEALPRHSFRQVTRGERMFPGY
jgi:hypothetical protein